MICPLLLAAMLAAGPDVDGLRRELDDVAGRIEELKARRRAGAAVEDGSLERLLVRSQELAEELERARPRPQRTPPAGADPGCTQVDELREQAAVLREEAASLFEEAIQVNAELARAVREEPPHSRRTTFASDVNRTVLDPASRVASLAERRAALERQARALEAEASLLDAAADALERSGTVP